MAINCSNNAALEKLQASKDALNAALDNAASAGRAALAAVDAAAKQLEADLKAAIPELPELPNFKKELQALAGKVGAELAEAKAAFKERWGDSLPDIDIDDLMNKVSGAISLVENFEDDLEDFVTGATNLAVGAVTNIAGDALSGIAGAAGGVLSDIEDAFDFCKDVPNIEGTVDPVTQKIATVKDKGAEPTPAQEPPKAAEPVIPTVTDAAQAPSLSPVTKKSYKELQEAKEPYDAEIALWHEINVFTQKPQIEAMSELKKSPAYIKMNTRYRIAGDAGATRTDWYNTFAEAADKTVLDEYFINDSVIQFTELEKKLYNQITSGFFRAAHPNNNTQELENQLKEYYKTYLMTYTQVVVTNGIAKGYRVSIDTPVIYKAAYRTYRSHKTALLEYRAYTS